MNGKPHGLGKFIYSDRFSFYEGEYKKNLASVSMFLEDTKELSISLDFIDESENKFICHTGVPHLVLEVENIKSYDLLSLAKKYRHHPFFAAL